MESNRNRTGGDAVSTASRIEDARVKLDDAQGLYEGVEFGDDAEERQEGLDGTALALVGVIGDLLDVVRDLRAEGADVADFPGDLAAAQLVIANTPKLIAGAVADMRMIEARIAPPERQEIEGLRAIMATAVEELADPDTRPGDEAAWRDRVADAVEAMRAALDRGGADGH